ncbi:MAG: hypothetical protein U9Q98_08665 [Bacteroidota bacterium]|nr:hypothetical protein [Bacteroidota bacterium]
MQKEKDIIGKKQLPAYSLCSVNALCAFEKKLKLGFSVKDVINFNQND